MPRLPSTIPADLRARLEAARLDLLALFRALDQNGLDTPGKFRSDLCTSFLNWTPIRKTLNARESYNMVPERNPRNG